MTELPNVQRANVQLDDEALALATTRDEASAAAMAKPDSPAAWAALAQFGRDAVERYAYARVGYHRGLDMMRRNGWGGTGYVRWNHVGNQGVLRCIAALRDAAAEIGETAEVDRLNAFLVDLDPEWSDDNISARAGTA